LSKLIVVTFSDKELAEDNYLKNSCNTYDLDLKVIIHSPWEFNAIKIKLLYDWLKDIPSQTLILATDALDVVIYDNESTILRKFEQIEGDIIFSVESNFYFRNRKLIKKYWKAYPRQHTVYDYLNSGTYLGAAGDLTKMISAMVEKSDISLEEEKLRILRSDQYAFSKYYVDAYSSTEGVKIRLDHEQKLMGCSGGRFSVIPFPDLGKMQAFLFFFLERNILKKFRLHKHQNQSKDFQIKEGRFFNKKTKQFPSVIHLPGTWENFEMVIGNFLSSNNPTSKNIFALSISIISFLLSTLLGLLFSFPKNRSSRL